MRYFLWIFFLAVSIYAGNRDLIIILDWEGETEQDFYRVPLNSEKVQTAELERLLNALFYQAAPVIISVVTLNNFLARATVTGDFLHKNIVEVYARYSKQISWLTSLSEFNTFKEKLIRCTSDQDCKLPVYEEKNLSIMIYCYILFQELSRNFDIYQINDHFVLLVPKIYVKRMAKQIESKDKATDISHILGMNIQSIKHQIKTLERIATPIEKYEQAFLDAMRDLLLDSKDSWYIYLAGHGTAETLKEFGKVAGLTQEYLEKFLSFLKNRMSTECLFLSSCFLGGENLYFPYEVAQDNSAIAIGQTYPFFLFIETFAATLTYSQLMFTLPSPLKYFMRPDKYKINFLQFFQRMHQFMSQRKKTIKEQKIKGKGAVHKLGRKKYNQEIYAAVYTVIFPESRRDAFFPFTLPAVRYPNTEWFTLLDPSDEIFHLTDVRIQIAHKENKSINIENKLIISLEAPLYVGVRSLDEIGKKVTLKVPMRVSKFVQGNFPYVLSVVPGNVSYRFKEIEAIGASFLDIVQSFMVSMYQDNTRFFYIDKLRCTIDQKDIESFTQINDGSSIFETTGIIELEHVAFYINGLINQKRQQAVFFMVNNTIYVANWLVNQKDISQGLLEKKSLKLFVAAPANVKQTFIDTWQKTFES